jgi:predicted nucleic acid-binding protein
MTSGLDTSFLIRLLTDDPPEQAAKAREWLERCLQRGDRPKVTDMVIVEAYFALQTHYSVPKAEALQALQQLLESGDVEPVGFALGVLQKTPNLASAKPGFVDRLIHAEFRSHGCQLPTFEKAAARLPATKVL